MSGVDVGIVIVHYADPEVLAQCLSSLPDAIGKHSWHAVVVDNSPAGLSGLEGFGQIEVLRNTTNVGFARAVNQGACRIAAPWLLVLNPDTRLEPDCICGLLGALEADPGLALVGPGVLNEDGSLQGSARRDPTLMTGIIGRRSWIRRMAPSLPLAHREVLDTLAVKTGRSVVHVDWVSGVCQCMRRSAFDRVGGFDERYFLYFEDADLCRRLRMAGWKIGYVPENRLIHLQGSSSRHVPYQALRHFHESALRYYQVYHAPQAWNPLRQIARVILTARRMAIEQFWKYKESRRERPAGTMR